MEFKAFEAEVYQNTKVDKQCVLLDRFAYILEGLHLGNKTSGDLIECVLHIAKFNNRLNAADKYLRYLCKILLQTPEAQSVATKLEVLLNTEIAIKKRDTEAQNVGDFAIHHNVIA